MRFDYPHGERCAFGDLFEHLGDLEVAAPDKRAVIDLLDVVADTDALELIHNAALLDALDERVAGAVVRDRQAQRVLVLRDVHHLGLTLDVREDEVLEPDLPTQQP